MKIDPAEVRVVLAGQMVCLYRDRTLIEEVDSMRRPVGILHACGLYRSSGEAAWFPGCFRFRRDKARPTTLTVDGDYLLPWLMAGVILGERTARYRKTGEAIFIDPGRLEDQSIAAGVWRDWLRWRSNGSPGTFARFTLRKEKLRFEEDQRIHKIVHRLGLPVGMDT